MDDFEELEGKSSVDFTQPDNIQAEPGQRTGEDAKGEATVLAQTVANSASESRVEPFAKSGLEESSDEAARTGQPRGETANDFKSWESLLLSSEKGGLGRKNSKYFKRVQDALQKTAVVLSKNFSNVVEDNRAMLLEACNVFQALLDACKQYTARNPRTKNGKVRRDIVLQIQNYAEKDLSGCGSKLSEFYVMSADDQAKETWQSVLGGARTVQLTVKDFSQLGPPGGGQASEVFKIETQGADGSVTKYFKKEDSLDMDLVKEKGAKAPRYIAMQDTLQKYPGLAEEEIEKIQKLQSGSKDALIEGLKLSEEGTKAAKYYIRRWKQLDTNIVHLMQPLGIEDEGGMANMSRRNVATSRIAGLLGLGNLVAKSETAEIYDEATGKTIRGNLMDQAEGEENEKITDKLMNNEITPGFMRDIMNLQVLDMLCGQVDRHTGNMLYKTDGKGKVSGIQGIDNDAAFGTNTDAVSAKDGERKDARVFDAETNEMEIPYMDDELATRIEKLDSDVVKYVLRDLLKEAEIDAAIRRLEVMKAGIQKARKDYPERFLKGEESWTLIKKAEEQPKENQPSVQQDLINQYKYVMFQSNMDARKNSQLVVQTASEMFEDDPETVEAICLLEMDPEAFKEAYTEDEQKQYERDRETVRNVCKVKLKKHYYGSMNYFGRIMSENGVST